MYLPASARERGRGKGSSDERGIGVSIITSSKHGEVTIQSKIKLLIWGVMTYLDVVPEHFSEQTTKNAQFF